MKSSYAALGVVGLAIAGLWYAGGGTTVSTQSVEQLRVSSPVVHENLTVFFIHGPDAVANAKVATLQEAMEAGWAVIHETGNVNNLTVENQSTEYELFIQEGDIIRGGRQDRMIASDMLLPPKSGLVSFPCNCVEQGRWTGRGNEAATHFNKSDQFAVGNIQKVANINLQQSAVWNSVEEKQKELAKATQVKVTSDVSATSFQLTLETAAIKAKITDYEEALKSAVESQKNTIGVVFLVNGEMTGAEIYGSNALFQKAWPKLLRSAATEALADKKDKPLPPTPSAKEVERFLVYAGNLESPARANQPSQNRRPGDNQNPIHRPPNSLPATDWPLTNVNAATTSLVLRDKIENENVQFEGNVNDMTLNELLTDLSRRCGVTFVIMDEYFKADTGMEIKEQKPKVASTKLNGLKLGTFLDLVLASLNATFIVRPDYVEITTLGRRLEERVARVNRGDAIYQTEARPNQTVSRPRTGQDVDESTSIIRTGRGGQVRIEGTETTTDRVITNQLDRPIAGFFDAGTLQGAQQPSNPVGNRLNINRIETAAGLMTESRDPTRENAVIHKSFIKLGSNQK